MEAIHGAIDKSNSSARLLAYIMGGLFLVFSPVPYLMDGIWDLSAFLVLTGVGLIITARIARKLTARKKPA